MSQIWISPVCVCVCVYVYVCVCMCVWGGMKFQTLLYKGGELQLWTHLLISFSHDF